MSMEDKILDDDDIIDLTDLLEEGDAAKKNKPKKEGEAKGQSRLNEPDSFDLGKEISMEYDVSVEEIDQGGEALDMNGSLSKKEQAVLADDKSFEALLDEKTGKAPEAPSPEPAAAAGPEVSPALEEPAPAPAEEPAPAPEEEPAAAPVEAAPAPEEEPATAAGEAAPEAVVIPVEPVYVKTYVDAQPPAAPAGNVKIDAAVMEELRQQAPAVIEAIVRPLMEELVRDMIAATREQLPGIVEKVIREEIEKLKKLNS